MLKGYEIEKKLSNPQRASKDFYWLLSTSYRETEIKNL